MDKAFCTGGCGIRDEFEESSEVLIRVSEYKC